MTPRPASSPGPAGIFRPTWAEVDLSKILRNLKKLRSAAGTPGRIMFVVKADAYGHGALACALAAQEGRAADWLGVSSVEEGLALRSGGISLPILILGSLYPFESFSAAAEHRLSVTIASLDAAKAVCEAAAKKRASIACHLKIETGMGRIGMGPAMALRAAEFIAARPPARLEGVYTHLSCPLDRAFTLGQLSAFSGADKALRRAGLRPLRHAAASAAALKYPSARYDMIRPGLAAYGLYPGFEPALSLKTRAVFIKTVPKGTPISYGATFRTRKRASRIVTLPAGYADGVSRRLSNKGWALLGGRRRPVVGAVTMDMTMIDAGASGARIGEEAVLIGRQGSAEIGAEEIARSEGTIPYEIVCSISARVPRIYLK